MARRLLDESADPDPQNIATQQDFGRELSLARQRAGRTVREVARAAGLPASTAGDYFSGRHLPPASQPGLLPEILLACGESDPARVREWTSALARARRAPGRRASGARPPVPGTGELPARRTLRWFFGRAELTERSRSRSRRRRGRTTRARRARHGDGRPGGGRGRDAAYRGRAVRLGQVLAAARWPDPPVARHGPVAGQAMRRGAGMRPAGGRAGRSPVALVSPPGSAPLAPS